MNLFLLLAIVVPAGLVAFAIAVLRRSAWATRLADHPNERSLHVDPTPRIGGLGIAIAVAPFALAAAPPPLRVLLGCAALLVIVSFRDDLKSLPVLVRLAVHAVAAIIAVTSLGDVLPLWMQLLAVLAIAWMTNLYNFMDGSDGLAGGMAVVGFGTLGWAAYQGGDLPLAATCVAIASAGLGFLGFNFPPPARVFMGDAGSIPLGFLAGAFGAYGIAHGLWPPEFPLLVFLPFIADATVTLAKRLLRGEKFWAAHRSHYYQRLVLAGWSRRRLALTAWVVMAACAAAALAGLRGGEMLRCAILLAGLVAFIAMFAAIDFRLAHGRAKNNNSSREP